MWQLRANGRITHNIIAFNLRSEYGTSSYIKFGGIDSIAIKGNTTDNMKLFRTNSEKKWTIPVENFATDNNTRQF